MKTPFHHIFDTDSVGQIINPLPLNHLLRWANLEQIEHDEQCPKTLFLGIDIQQDFMDNGALGVPGAMQDVIRLGQFIYNNIEKISSIIVSLDTHEPAQIFHPYWWMDEAGNHPAPYTVIKPQDLTDGKWRAVIDPALSKHYVRQLEKTGKQLTIWPYHCINGTTGWTLENQFSNIIHFMSVAANIPVEKICKGQNRHSEMYGIIRPEYSTHDSTNTKLLEKIAEFDRIIVAGEAKSHCVLESI